MNLQELAPYLPYEVKIKYLSKDIYKMVGFANIEGVSEFVLFTDEFGELPSQYCKPILRPLSDLTKPCLEDGRTPIVELGLIACRKPKWNITLDEYNRCYIGTETNPFKYIFRYSEKENYFYCTHVRASKYRVVPYQLELFQWLYKNHFWLGDQSRFGQDIIDINSI